MTGAPSTGRDRCDSDAGFRGRPPVDSTDIRDESSVGSAAIESKVATRSPRFGCSVSNSSSSGKSRDQERGSSSRHAPRTRGPEELHARLAEVDSAELDEMEASSVSVSLGVTCETYSSLEASR